MERGVVLLEGTESKKRSQKSGVEKGGVEKGGDKMVGVASRVGRSCAGHVT